MSGGCGRALLAVSVAVAGLIVLAGAGALWILERLPRQEDLARASAALLPGDPSPALRGRLVSVTGELAAAAPLGDGLYLRPGPYLRLERRVQVYRDGGDDGPAWQDVDDPRAPVPPLALTAPAAALGGLSLDTARLALPPAAPLRLVSTDLVSDTLPASDGYLFYRYLGRGTLERPAPGDLRISYAALPAQGQHTLLGQWDGARLVPHTGELVLYRLFRGDRAAMLAELEGADRAGLWLSRGLYLGVVWLGLLIGLFATRPALDWPARVPLLGSNPFALAAAAALALGLLVEALARL